MHSPPRPPLFTNGSIAAASLFYKGPRVSKWHAGRKKPSLRQAAENTRKQHESRKIRVVSKELTMHYQGSVRFGKSAAFVRGRRVPARADHDTLLQQVEHIVLNACNENNVQIGRAHV